MSERVADLKDWVAEEQLLRVAWYYYVDQLTQDDIAKRMQISRAGAGRLLERCRQAGIVTFTINSDHYEAFQLARLLKEKFGLREALVPPTLEDDLVDQGQINARLGRGAAQYLQSHLKADDVLGMGWGDTVQQTMRCVSSDVASRVSTVSLTGGVGAYVNTLRRVRNASSNAPADHVLPTPIVASSEALASALLKETEVQRVLGLAKTADHAIVGIGGMVGAPTIAQLGYTTEHELDLGREAGAVGDILGVYYDAKGEVVDLPIHKRRIGISLDDLRKIPNVIGVAAGESKIAAIRGALKGGYLDVLVTTEAIARKLIEEE
ncbi:sugar-binding transcriptional regulator [Timonella senegalensis]|uniref:sugar-binding transcriptional regulator n=1 Tax=Timonella senegalensis TaxID=1465825 RepID=UPI0002D83EBA|nr:sugar-binding transcriptional regulator [Timonella senegalensis]